MFRSPAGFLFTALFIFIFSCQNAYAQPQLPDMAAATQNGLNILSWTNQYDGLKTIAVQRSADSNYNFVTIGYVKDLKKGPQAFIDGHPSVGKNWYRLYIVFASDLTWYSNRQQLYVDSLQLIKQRVLPPNDSLQNLASRVRFVDTTGTAAVEAATGKPLIKDAEGKRIAPPVLELTVPDVNAIDAYAYIKSKFVFTNPFTGHVNIEIPDAQKTVYTVNFFDSKNREILHIDHIPETSVILDKRNFQKKGIYRFELLNGKQKLEMGYITIY